MSKRKEKRLAKARKRKRIFQLVGGIGLAGILTASILSYKALSQKLDTNHNQYHSVASSLEEITFEEAKQDKRLRKSYIDQIIKNYPPPIEKEKIVVKYNDKVNFISHPFFSDKRCWMETKAFSPRYSKSGVQSVELTVYRGSFGEFQSEGEFLTGLVNHEYEHIRLFSGKVVMDIDNSVLQEFKKRALDVGGDLFLAFQELFAFSNEIRSFSTRKDLRDTHKKSVIESYNAHRRIVEEKPETPLTKWLLEKYPKLNNQ